MNHDEILAFLNTQASAEYKKNVVRMGIPEECCIGVPIVILKKLAKQLKRSNDLAYALWNDGYHEAKLLAVLLFDHQQLTLTDIDMLMSDVISWDLCNHLCKHLIVKMEHYETLIFKWITASFPYKKRAAFILIGTRIIKHKQISDEELDSYLSIISEHSSDEHEHVKKGVSYALKEIGKRDFKYNEKALILAYELLDKGNKAQQWIARDVIKELENMVKAKGRERLISAQSQMAQQ